MPMHRDTYPFYRWDTSARLTKRFALDLVVDVYAGPLSRKSRQAETG